MKNFIRPATGILMLIVSMASSPIWAQNFEKISSKRAAVEYNCAAEKITVMRSAKYSGGALVVLNVCDHVVFYECMGTVCQPRCTSELKPTDYAGEGESAGKYHKLVMERAAVEFDNPQTEIRQIKHFDDKGQGLYYLAVKGNEVVYECMGSVCNLKCK